MTSAIVVLPFLILAAAPAAAPRSASLKVMYWHAGLYSMETDGRGMRCTCKCLRPRQEEKEAPPELSAESFVSWPPGTQLGGGPGPLVEAVLSAEQSARLRELLDAHDVGTLVGPDSEPESRSYGSAFRSRLWIVLGDDERKLEWTGDSLWTAPEQKARVIALVQQLQRFCADNACQPACDAAEKERSER
jgi:hypothetical protein